MTPRMQAKPTPWLVGDVGGTNARFALCGPRQLHEPRVLACAEHASLQHALRSFLRDAGVPVRHAAIGIANPVHGDRVRMTNHHWEFSIEAARRELGLDTLLLINDFAALAMSLPHLPRHELQRIGGGRPAAGAACAVVGPGTGLGVAGLLPLPDGAWHVAAGEGGHVAFRARDDEDMQLLRFARARHGPHVSTERLLSGPGLELIHDWLCERAGLRRARRTAAQITELGLCTWRAGEAAHAQQAGALCLQALQRFCALLGGFAADVALTFDARGGLYIGGGIVPRLGDFVEQSLLRERFEDKGRFSSLLAGVPVFVIHSRYPALLGAAAALRQHMERVHPA